MCRIILVRHTQVSPRWKGRCYGQSDIALSPEGRVAAHNLAGDLASTFSPRQVVSSPLRRAQLLAAHVSRLTASPLVIEPRLMECHFGTWEGRPWDDIWRETGAAMMGMVEAPDNFRPGDGETTLEVRDRAMAWLAELATDIDVMAVCHGGPIAAIRGTLAGLSVAEWSGLVPSPGEAIVLER
jgi:broad specificity phosphatase PhoE